MLKASDFFNENYYNIDNILSEADDPNAMQAQDQPMEASADMSGNDAGMGEAPPAEPGEGESSDQADQQQNGEVSPMGDPNQQGMGMDMNGGMVDGQNADPEDIIKKRRLFKDYKELYTLIEDLFDISSMIHFESLSDDSKKIFNFIEKKMDENKDKLKIIMTEKFNELEYKELMMLFIYIKTATKSYAELLKYFSLQSNENNK